MSYKSLTARYVFALSAIGFAALGAFACMGLLVMHASTHTLIVQNLETQEDLSQEVVRSAAAFVHAQSTAERDQTRKLLHEAVAALESSHRDLLDGSDEIGYPGDDTPALTTFLYEGESSLSAITRTYLERVRHLLMLPPNALDANHPDVRFILGEGAQKLAQKIARAHLLFRASATAKINRVLAAGAALVCLLWLVLIAEALFIFRPMARTIENERSELRRLNDELARLATIDTLTGACNRRKFLEIGPREWAATRRTGNPMAILLFDIDHFKMVNDRHGHEAGDRVLKMTAGAFLANIRETDYLFRWGGEEFLVLAPNTGPEGALALAEKLRAAVAACETNGLRVTISGGLTLIDSHETSVEEALRRADHALYQAKENGRNQIQAAAILPPVPGANRQE